MQCPICKKDLEIKNKKVGENEAGEAIYNEFAICRNCKKQWNLDKQREKKKKLAKEAKNYPRRDFGEKFNQKYEEVLQKAEQRKEELEINGQKVTLVREEPFAAARDSVDFKVYLMIWKEKWGNRIVDIEEFL